MVTQSIWRYMMSLKLNLTEEVAISISSKIWQEKGAVECSELLRASVLETLLNKLKMSKEQRKTKDDPNLVLMMSAKVKESCMQLFEYKVRSGF